MDKQVVSITSCFMDLTEQVYIKDGRIQGVLSFYWNDLAKRMKMNVTYIRFDGLGSYDEASGNYTGILGGIESKQCDTSLYPLPIDAIGSGFFDGHEPDLVIGSALVHSNVYIASVPLSEKQEFSPTVIDTFGCLETGTSFMLMFLILLLFMLFKAARNVVHLKQEGDFRGNNVADLETATNKSQFTSLKSISLFTLYASAFNQSSIESSSPSTTTIYRLPILLFVMLAFWFFQYFTSFISMELTVSEPEKVIDSLHDLDKSNLQPLLMKGMNIKRVLESSKLPGVEGILRKVLANESEAIFEMSQMNILNILSSVFNRKGAYIMDILLGTATQFAACVAFPTMAMKYRRSQETIHAMVSYEVSATNVVGSREKQERIDKLSRGLFHSGLHQYYYTIKGTLSCDYYTYALPNQQLCLYEAVNKDKLFDQTETVEPIGLHYVSFMFYLLIGGWTLGLIAKHFIDPVLGRSPPKTSRRKKN